MLQDRVVVLCMSKSMGRKSIGRDEGRETIKYCNVGFGSSLFFQAVSTIVFLLVSLIQGLSGTEVKSSFLPPKT